MFRPISKRSNWNPKLILWLWLGSAFVLVACAETAETPEIVPENMPTELGSEESSATEPAATAPGADDFAPAVAEGFVFEDLNNNGQLDEGEPGLSGLSVVALFPDGRRLVTGTDDDGFFRFEEPLIEHRIFVNTGFFPESFVLTTGNEFYDIRVLPGEVRSGLIFGYRDRELSTITGMVFDDLNGNGVQDDGEPGLSDVKVLGIAHDETLTDGSDLTNENGRFRMDFADVDHEVMVDDSTLPDGYSLSSDRDVFRLFLPPGVAAIDIDFGYKASSE